MLRAVKVQDMERNKHEHMKRERNAGEASIIGNKKELEMEGRTSRIEETTDVTETRNCNRNMEAYRHGDSLRLQCSKWHQGTSVHSNGSERNKTRQARNLSRQGINKTRQAS